ncbi:hypothetical protein HSX11_22585 [Oxalobacteraceae bacterium]|nr:hypothetical protein [Oxalobacteraceae bacterium]
MHHASHSTLTGSEYCETCGQKLPVAEELGYGARKRSNRIGIAISVGLHLLAVLYYVFRPAEPFHRTPPPSGGSIVYVEPLKQPKQPAKQQPKKTEQAKAKPAPAPKPTVAAITPPAAARPKLETYVPPVVAPMQPPPEEDMATLIAKRRAQRAANSPAEPAPETDAERGIRIAKANIAGAQSGRSNGADRNDSGGVLQVVDKTFNSADIKFRGWNGNFKRNWSQQIHVDLGTERDIETATIKRMIELIRKEKPGDFMWESQRLGRTVPMSARKEDEAELHAFLLKEFFPEYRR